MVRFHESLACTESDPWANENSAPRLGAGVRGSERPAAPAQEELTAFERDCRAWCGKSYHCGDAPEYDPESSICVDRCEDEYDLKAVDFGLECEAADKAIMARLGAQVLIQDALGPIDVAYRAADLLTRIVTRVAIAEWALSTLENRIPDEAELTALGALLDGTCPRTGHAIGPEAALTRTARSSC